jgi:hypothetical protein
VTHFSRQPRLIHPVYQSKNTRKPYVRLSAAEEQELMRGGTPNEQIVQRLYEDNVLGTVTNEQSECFRDYNTDQKSLKEEILRLRIA